MKQLLFGLLIIGFASLLLASKQSGPNMEIPDYPSYEEQWVAVGSLEKEGKTKDAQAKVESIYQLAKRENNAPQVYKSLLYLATYTNVLQENADLSIVNRVKEEIEASDTPTKQLLQSALGNLYWQYFQNNRYKFYNRTTTSGGTDSEDFRTWDRAKIIDEAEKYYNQSISPSQDLHNYQVKDFIDILAYNTSFDEYMQYRPTLYDLLAHQAIQFYANDESGTNKPTDQFQIREEQAFGTVKQFLNYKPTTTDSESRVLKTIQLYQELLASKTDEHKASLIHTNLERLKYVKQNSVLSNKEELFEDALKKILKTESHEEVSLVGYELAQLCQQQGNQFDANQDDEANRWKLTEAIAICEDMIAKYPETLGAQNCRALIETLNSSFLNLTLEQEILPNQPFKFLIEYKNVDQVQFNLLKASDKLWEQYQNLQWDERKTFIQENQPDYTWITNTPKQDDLQPHSFEAIGFVENQNDLKQKMSNLGLEPGQYIIWLNEPDKELQNYRDIRINYFQVTDIAYFSKERVKGQSIHVVDQTTGEPLSNAGIKVIATKYNEGQRTFNFNTNKEGVVKIDLPKRFRVKEFHISHGGQTAKFLNHYYREIGSASYNWNNRGFLFTDRSIYRPGQVVHFKSILTSTNNLESKIVSDKKVQVVFRDANYGEISRQTLKSNDYGSIQGTYTIPQGRVLGNYTIEVVGFVSQYFSVEEYKRPKFKVEVLPLEGNFKVNQKIKVEGEAIAFAGSVISDAEVSYRVIRETRYPYYFSYWYRFSRPRRGESQEIAFGKTTTDELGKFIIPFIALPDESTNEEDFPVFDYIIEVDVTDVNGETRSVTGSVVVGYTAMELSITESDWEKGSKAKIQINSKNLNGQAIEATGKVEVVKLTSPGKFYRKRPWAQPDTQIIPEGEYRRLFPYEAYSDFDGAPTLWKEGKTIIDKNFTTNDEGFDEIELKTKSLDAGYYKIKVKGADAFGKEIETESVVYLSGDEKEKKLADHELLDVSFNQDTYQPGDEATVTFKTGLEDVWLWVEVYRDQEVVISEFLHLTKKPKTISFNIAEKDRGGMALNYAIVKNGQHKVEQLPISIPWTNKQLQIEVATFRDKLKPGEDETWSFTVKGEKGDAVSAEFLTTMYDASLDEFRGHSWNFTPSLRQQGYSPSFKANGFTNSSLQLYIVYSNQYSFETARFPALNSFGFSYNRIFLDRGYSSGQEVRRFSKSAPAASFALVDDSAFAESEALDEVTVSSVSDALSGEVSGVKIETQADEDAQPLDVVARKNLQETAFFFPDLSTDEDGNVIFSFTTPEALTEWKVMALGHTKELEFGQWSGNTVTQKELMVLPNAPRFLRQGDKISFSSKIANLQDKEVTGVAELVLLDATTLEPVYSKIGQTTAQQNFTIDAKGNAQVTWDLTIPDDVPAVTYKVLAKAGNFSDGEENALPVLSNRKLVTETMPIAIRSNQTKTYVLDKLANNNSNTLKNHKLTLEMTSNPAWYAVQALPYLMEFPYECAEQTFSRYYANTLATHVANSNPKIKSVFDTWRTTQPDALKSNLEKNQELKELMLRETPWVREAQSEAEQKRRIALLFDINKMATEQSKALNQLKQQQMNSGGWAWFKGGRENRYITQHIVAGLGHLDALGVEEVRESDTAWAMTKKAVQFLDNELTVQYRDLQRYNKDWKNITSVSQIVVHYYYVRSFFPDLAVNDVNQEAYDFYWEKMKIDWLSEQLYRNGLAALAFHRNGEIELADKIVEALDQNSIISEELGMYWKANTPSWWWYQAPIETQALMIEVFDEIRDDQNAVDELKVWLLKNKQTNRWETTKATSEAVYALLLRGGEWLSVDDMVQIQVGSQTIDPKNIDGVKAEAGTGYFKTSWTGGEISKDQAEVTVSKTGEGIAWGAVYWQYFEDLDKITSAETPLQLSKQLFLQENTKSGPEISPVDEGQSLQIGDLLKVRIELKVDRDMEFVHMKDMRAAGFEPTNVLSQYKWQDGLGYYESTKDASTDFFFDYLPKGVYVFEYPLRVNNAGNMSNGITTIQCMYAPEFTSHSEGVRVKVEK